MTRSPTVGTVGARIAAPAGATPAVSRHVPRASGNGPMRVLSLPLVSVALDPTPSRPGSGPSAMTDEEVLLRLALWLADVAAEAAPAASFARAVAARHQGTAEEPPIAESAP
jgi:hypothetical protein